MSEREREELQRDLEERGKQLEVQRQLHGEEFPKDDEVSISWLYVNTRRHLY